MQRATKTLLHAAVAANQDFLEKMQWTLEDLQEKFDNRTDTWQESEKGSAVQQEIEFLETAIADLETAIESLTQCIEND